ncbi:MAG: glucan biosynthesis protein G [Pseudomonadota bacterium]
MTLSRRTVLGGLLALAAQPASALGELVTGEAPFSFDWLKGEAERLSKIPYSPMPQVPKAWRDLSYDQFRKIWFNTHKAIWADEPRPLQVDLLPAGVYFDRPVDVSIVKGGIAQTLGFDISLFDKTDKFPMDLPLEGMGYSGLRLRTELNKRGIFEEFMVFQGASYFRAIANGQTYGLSARGLAIGTGDRDGEEFPDFRAYWVEAPAPEDDYFVVHALLDGPSITGAYSFMIRPGAPTEVSVAATLYPRVDLDNAGLAPLTSMFLFDETNRHRFDDFRPSVHDSEGLMVWNGNGERIWRPLANHNSLQISAFVDETPQGFGLMQRAREVRDFADFEARYENRPSLWITPEGDWGKGYVRLIEIPADREIYDNIVAYWVPREPMIAGQSVDFAYKMTWGETPVGIPNVAAVTNTRIGKGFDQVKTVVTIDYEDHPALEGDLDDVTIHVGASRGPVSDGILQRNPGTGGARLAFSFVPGEKRAIEFRAQLLRDGKTVTEVWLYRWTAG